VNCFDRIKYARMVSHTFHLLKMITAPIVSSQVNNSIGSQLLSMNVSVKYVNLHLRLIMINNNEKLAVKLYIHFFHINKYFFS